MERSNTILIIDDDREVLAYYFKLFEVEDMSSFDILGEKGTSTRRWKPTIRHYDPDKFDEMFESMVSNGFFYPLCIIDLRMPVPPDYQIDPRRGVATAIHVRGLDPAIHIIICTADPEANGPELMAQVGGSTHFFRLPFGDHEEERFCGKVRELIDVWNEGRQVG